MNDWYKQAFYRVSVVGLIQNDNDEILMVHEHGRWTIPGGGWDYEEPLHEALQRELFEEIALTSEFTEDVFAAIPFYNPNKKAWQLWIVCDISYDSLEYSVGEHAAGVCWMKKDEIDSTTVAGQLIQKTMEAHATKNNTRQSVVTANPTLPVLEKGVYRHTKSGKLYEVTGMTFHTETNEPLVLYAPLYESEFEIFARPYAIFTEAVNIHGNSAPRFEKV